jgi:hypothetical protein
MDVTQFWHTLLITSLGAFGAFGLLALVNPRLFAAVATFSSQWVNSKRFFDFLDRRINVDKFVLPHSRLLGVLVLASVVAIGYVFRVA